MSDLKSTPLEKIYDPSEFRQLGHQMVDLLADHFEKVQKPEHPVLTYRDPEDELAYWKKDFSSETEMIEVFKNMLDHSIAVHHPRYIGHQISVPAFVSGLAGLMSLQIE